MPAVAPPGPAVSKLTAAVGAIEDLQAWKGSFETSTRKAQKVLRAKNAVTDETVKLLLERIRYLEEIMGVEGMEEMEGVDGGDVGAGAENDDGVTVVGAEDDEVFKISKEMGTSKEIKVSQ